ncbi:hypothetical protein EDB86DRAFT_3131337 [Lactarius hatsudake]|nr:hypothetical protein EDB86DRAFT_3131337 [Lactarius hatsudake]
MFGSRQPNKTVFNFVSPFGALASSSWSSSTLSADLLTILSASNAPAPPSAHPVPAFDSPDEETPITEPVQFKAASRSLPFEPTQALSPRGSPPKISPPVRQDVQAPEPPLGRRSVRELEGTRRWSYPWLRIQSPDPVSGLISQPPTIVVDVVQPLYDTQAPRDAVK